MKKIYTSIILVLATITLLFSQVPEAFNYQAVVRNSSGEIITNTNVAFRISILQGSETGTPVYVETHSVNTNNFGLVNLQIGKGTVTQGVFMPGDWGAASHFIKVEFDKDGGTGYVHLGTSPLLSVPYAFHAQTVAEDAVDDADADATNEIQSLQLSGTQLTLSKNGGTVTLPSSGGGGDNWGTQTVKSDATLSGEGTTANPLKVENNAIQPTWANIQDKPGGFADNNDDVEDGDANPNNEIQTLSISGNDLTISDGNTVSLPAGVSSPWQSSGNDIFFNSGKVGIGTSLPYHNVTINGKDGSTTQLCLQNNSSGGEINDGLLLGINITNNASYLWNYENAVMAFGTNNTQRMLISSDGNVAIGEFLIPTAALHVNGNDGVLFEGTLGSGTIPKEGEGTRMMWYPKKGAFRTGVVNGTLWNDSKIGLYSVAMGTDTEASGENSTAMGLQTTATGEASTALGSNSIASGQFAISSGNYTKARGQASTALGSSTEAIAFSSAALGYETKTTGLLSFAAGHGTIAESWASFAIGSFNVGGGDPESWIETDPVFEIGNGEGFRRNAVTVLKNGNVGIGADTPERLLHLKGANPRILLEASSSNPEINFKNTGDVSTSIWSIYKNGSNGDLHFYQNGNKLTLQKNTGNVGIGTTTPQGKLDVNGTIYQRGGVLHADYVFEEDYQLESIAEHAEFMWENKHLPAIPKATTDENGVEIVEVGSHRKGIVEELEKAHIYISQLEKAIQEQAAVINGQGSRLERLESLIKAIASK